MFARLALTDIGEDLWYMAESNANSDGDSEIVLNYLVE